MLVLKNVSVGYENRYFVRGVNLEFEPGKIYAVVGKNGSGKSDLLKMCCGRSALKTGSVLLDGKELSEYSAGELAQRVAYLSQHVRRTGLTPKQTFAKLKTSFPHSIRKVSKEDIGKLYTALGQMKMAGFDNSSMRGMSRGELQRAQLALLLAMDTPIVLLDEPLTYMDIAHQFSFMELLTQLKKQGKTIVIATHALQLALKYCDRMIVVDAGKEIIDGTPEELRKNRVLEQVFHVDGSFLES